MYDKARWQHQNCETTPSPACSLQLAACIEFFFPIHTLLVLSHVTLNEYQLILAQA